MALGLLHLHSECKHANVVIERAKIQKRGKLIGDQVQNHGKGKSRQGKAHFLSAFQMQQSTGLEESEALTMWLLLKIQTYIILLIINWSKASRMHSRAVFIKLYMKYMLIFLSNNDP